MIDILSEHPRPWRVEVSGRVPFIVDAKEQYVLATLATHRRALNFIVASVNIADALMDSGEPDYFGIAVAGARAEQEAQ